MAKKTLEQYLECPFHLAMSMLEGRWKFAILYVLSRQGTLRFKELERAIPGISTRMLTKELKHLQEHGIVDRTAYATVPPKVEYALTPIGESTAPVIEAISQWGESYIRSADTKQSAA
ncbi:MAG: helix-turn-helix transcriptional regulator [Roseitalea sp.]|jgi:DNA-binding HxlR family transcriptional regulator|nr:helix-turn-helix transcriptional regulator [Roseitalea sp.]MBO6723922.1 helix-turn-helix transcriptional regulator [Roseitalea sp.]MBO6745384.1 helix-turn-helix transcriptional regulator [Roseitalea sp.]